MENIFKEQIDTGTPLTEDVLKEINKKCFDDGTMRPFKPGEICLYFLVQNDLEEKRALRIETTSNKCLNTLHKHFKLVSQGRSPIMEKL